MNKKLNELLDMLDKLLPKEGTSYEEIKQISPLAALLVEHRKHTAEVRKSFAQLSDKLFEFTLAEGNIAAVSSLGVSLLVGQGRCLAITEALENLIEFTDASIEKIVAEHKEELEIAKEAGVQ